MNKFNFDINGTALFITVMSEKSVRVTYGKNSPSESMIVRAKAAENILAGKYDSQRLFIVARKPDRFLRLIEAGVQLETLNVGNMSQSDETRAITRSINVVDADVEDFNKIHEKGVKITSQMVPNDTAEDFMKLLK